MRFIAFVLAIAAAWYGDFSSPQLTYRVLVPLGGCLCLVFVFGPIGALLMLTSVSCFYFTDVLSKGAMQSLVLPLLSALFFLAFCLHAWAYERSASSGSADFISGDIGDMGGGDGG
jgi:hypothetical protein